MSMKVQVLNANLVAMCMPHGEECHTSSAKRSAGASVLRYVVVRQPHMGSHPRSVLLSPPAYYELLVFNMQAVTVTV
jgi:hypothetical protein